MGFDGLIIESHCDPDSAWSDKAQQVSPDVLNFILNTIALRDTACTTESITLLRQQIDRIEIIESLLFYTEIQRFHILWYIYL